MKIRQILISAVLAAGCIFTATGCSEAGSVGNTGEITLVEGDKIAEINIQDYGTIKAKLFTDLAPIGAENFIQLAEQGYYDGLKIHRVVEGFMMQGGSLNGDGTGGSALYSGEGTYDEDFGIEVDNRARHFYGALCYANSLGRNTAQFYIVNNKEPQDLSQFVPSQIKETAAKYGEKKLECEEGSLDYTYYENYETYYTNLAEMIESASEEVKNKYKKVGGTPSLDGGYTVFGQVYEGFSVIDAIAKSAVETNAQGEKSKPVVDIIIDSVKIVTYTESTAEATAEADNRGTQTNANTTAPKTTPGSTTAAPTEPEEIDDNAPESADNSDAENSGGTAEQAGVSTQQAPESEAAPAETAEPSFQTVDTVEGAA